MVLCGRVIVGEKMFLVYKLPIINRFADIANDISYEIIGIILYLVLICDRY